jgi:hypothetical protein
VRGFIVEFDRLCDIFRRFARHSGVPDDRDRKLSEAFSLVQRNCRIFLAQASVHLSCLSPELDQRCSAPSSPLYRSGHGLMETWAIFVDLIRDFESGGIDPYVNTINLSFNTMFEAICTLKGSIPGMHFKTDVGCIGLLAFYEKALLLWEEIEALLLTPIGQRFVGFEPTMFRNRIASFMHAISDLFDHSLQFSCMTVATKITCRTALSSSTATIATALNDVRLNERTFNELKAQICDVNQSIARLFVKLRFPFALTLMPHEPNEPEKRDLTRVDHRDRQEGDDDNQKGDGDHQKGDGEVK